MPTMTQSSILPSDRHFRITHDPKLRVAYVHLVDRRVSGGSHRSVQALDGNVVIDLDKADRVVGIEFLDTRHLRPETLAEAERPPQKPEDFLDEKDRQVLLVAGEYRPPMIRGAGILWLRRLVRSLAAEIVRRGGAR
jgi:uncharacterized protein YuzE